MTTFGNVITAMVTPFKKDLSVDYDKACELAIKLLNSGSDSVVVAGTTGESSTLTHEEEFELFKAIKEAVGKKGKVIAGTGSNSTQTAIASTKKAEEIGVDGILSVVPYYNKPPQEGLYQHFKKIAEQTSLPIILYDIPGRCACALEVDTIKKLSEIKNIIGIKDAALDIAKTANIRKNTPLDFLIYSGEDSLTLPILSVGGVGCISVASHIVGKELQKMMKNFFAGNYEKAQKIHTDLMLLFKTLFITTNPIPIKTALNLLGVNVGSLRPPLIEATEEQKKKIKEVLEKYEKVISLGALK